MNFQKYGYHALAAVLLLITIMVLRSDFPTLDKYHYGADEGYYLHYANTLHDEGFIKGMHHLAEEHAEKVQRSVIPSPLRVFHMFCLWVFSYIFSGIVGLSWLSLISYALVVLVSYLFVYRIYGGVSAIIITALLATAPLGIGVSSRGLMDTTNYLLIVLSGITFIRYLQKPSGRHLALFIGIFVLCVLEKEVNVVLLPAFALVWLYEYWKQKGALPFLHAVIVAISIPLVCFASYMIFIGWDSFYTIFSGLGQGFKISPFTSYTVIYHSGPWYQFLVDYSILAPVAVMVSILGFGYLLASSTISTIRPVLILAFVFFTNVVFIATISMNVRYIIYIEWLMALVLAVAIPIGLKRIASVPLQRIVGIVLVGFLATYNYVQYNRIFVANETYDTINYNLLVGGNLMPKLELDAVINEERKRLAAVPLDEQSNALLVQSYQLYQNKEFGTVVNNCKAIIKIQPYHAETYNLLCAAYNELKLYHYAVEACNMALVVEPSYQLAKNNLAWANEQLQSEQ